MHLNNNYINNTLNQYIYQVTPLFLIIKYIKEYFV